MSRRLTVLLVVMLILTGAMGLKTVVFANSDSSVLMMNGPAPVPEPPTMLANGPAPVPEPPTTLANGPAPVPEPPTTLANGPAPVPEPPRTR